MADTPVFQGHHVIEQGAYRRSELLQALSERKLFDLHGPHNMLNLPADPALAAKMGLSPHPGGPLGAYTEELANALERLEISPDGQATLRGDQAAAQRIAARVNGLTDTLKVGLVNGDLVTNAPQGMTPEQANARIREFHGDLAEYRQSHAPQIAEMGKMSAAEARWAGVTQSEGNIKLALDAADQPGASTLSERWGGRPSLGTAIAEANQAGHLPLSDPLAARLRVAFPHEMPPIIARPPIVPRMPGVPGEGGIVAGEGAAAEAAGLRGPGARVAGAAGVALMAYDFAVTGHRVVQLQTAGNETAAQSAATHFVGRNAGGIAGGFLLGAGYGAATGSWTGPGALATGLVGGVAGVYLGERWAEQQDIKRIYTQPDGSGNEWTRNPEDAQGAWTRTVRAPTPNGGYQETRLLAAGRLVDELNYRAANDSYSLGLGSPPKPQDPYRLDASAETRPPREPFETGRDYVRDAQTGRWQVEIRENIDGKIPVTRNAPVSPERATELDRQSQTVIAQNAANTPEATAARYQIAYNQFGWNEFTSREPVPPVIANARAQPQSLQASDGNAYTRDASGEWSTPGTFYGTNQATGNTREELNRTLQSQQAGLQDMASMAEVARTHPTPTQSDLRSQVAGVYARAGITRTDEQIDAATSAVAQDHARDTGPTMPFFLQLQKDGSIATVVGQNDDRMEIRATTTAAEISQAQTQQARPAETPQPGAPTQAPQTQQPATPSSEAPLPSAPSSPTVPGRSSSLDDGQTQERGASTSTIAGQGAAPAMQLSARATASQDPPIDDQRSVDRQSPVGPKPQDAALVEQIRLSIAKLDESANKPWDERSDRMVASAYKLAVEAGFKPGDNVDVALNVPTDKLPGGVTMFVMRTGPGASPDPFANRANMPTQEAITASSEQQYLAANQTRDAQEQTRLQELAQARDRGPDDPSKSGPRMV
ncbi:XVIPCD domain-containing protein [Xanthomonas hortorum]|uniref:X-Tfes XVIPCD domain-containing protein n=1 Tax=Xanthomonas hortorum pv. pelargonii TaxID=453602 RepID=A0A6V7BBH3_9XANT|nr:XVIPCD domain-containing protein [Xanthomonas hortorum]MCE4356588.1 AHH domain-containing protein [Xanthomonas hortorum pv. pelargonii]MCM5526508.1 AHH domain-containing protein [Xanthomonas hortorum pv. pelargonii]MCM5538525.1 AHH domain-containing protein [Xanthomonas hortorum pv. pelargonii]MCM5540654.1 AHH domain-containing protein [Xanthomonas hortorum pv. pelargonii]MCM5546809.1 AHH domain-containing protein [Xanthomonas hortorum pv. pelargonii]